MLNWTEGLALTLGQADRFFAGGELVGRLVIVGGMDLRVDATSHILFFYTVTAIIVDHTHTQKEFRNNSSRRV